MITDTNFFKKSKQSNAIDETFFVRVELDVVISIGDQKGVVAEELVSCCFIIMMIIYL